MNSLLFLAASIVLTSYLTLSFKVVEKYRLNNLQVIVFNYFTAVITGSIVNGSMPLSDGHFSKPWFAWALLMGGIFIALFNLIAYTAQRIGVAVTSVANKLSMVIPFVFSMYLYNEPSTSVRVVGIIVALAAVVLTCLPKKNNDTSAGKRFKPALLLLPLILFIGSGLLDTLIKYVEQTFLDGNNNNDYLITAFGSAAAIGAVLLLFQYASGRQRFQPRAIIAGIAIGIPNYFSIWFLIRVLKLNPGESSAIIPVNNMGIVLFSAVMAFILFREKLSFTNWIGIILSIGAIGLIAFG